MKKHKSQPCPYCGKVYERSTKASADWNLANHEKVCLTTPKVSA